MNKSIMIAAGLGAMVEKVEHGKCPFCSSPIDETTFRDDLSLREFKISGLCQKCQDSFFKEPDEDDPALPIDDDKPF